MKLTPNFGTERAWPGGPLRKIGSSAGRPAKYVCELCQTSVVGLYRLAVRVQTQETWACAACTKFQRGEA
jgi:hypothetical protein